MTATEPAANRSPKQPKLTVLRLSGLVAAISCLGGGGQGLFSSLFEPNSLHRRGCIREGAALRCDLIPKDHDPPKRRPFLFYRVNRQRLPVHDQRDKARRSVITRLHREGPRPDANQNHTGRRIAAPSIL